VNLAHATELQENISMEGVELWLKTPYPESKFQSHKKVFLLWKSLTDVISKDYYFLIYFTIFTNNQHALFSQSQQGKNREPQLQPQELLINSSLRCEDLTFSSTTGPTGNWESLLVGNVAI
jgi:hypothetical protein